ncbi:hypothetical protein FLJC2902T_24630 [Flavobacterium limnosediminis JC2902]|uniref:DUF4168 domain-containing protein n=1 Tax=Flavobacterium limnosediminis JC2902 TaxID=1341181 RepID=V6SJN7_9FLAO|nr:hypothetical protein [Flavobacterium limnosediminis]ESU26492.1 hypothetical protein FLJC2902T_24630 [Flavobacterium limnosediminis JC2902]
MESFKKIILSFVLLFSLAVLSQTNKDKVVTNKDKVVTKRLYTEKEVEKIRQNYRKEVKTIGMSPAVEKKYAKIVTDYTKKLSDVNRDRTKTREQYIASVNRIVREQNSKIQKILTPTQYKRHLIIYNPYAESARYRIEHSK